MRRPDRLVPVLLALLLVGCGGGGGGGGPQPEVSTWMTSGVATGILVGCTDSDLEGDGLPSFASEFLGAPGFRVSKTGNSLNIAPQVISTAGGDLTVSGTGTMSSAGLVDLVLRFEVLPPLAPNLRWESFSGMARGETFPLAWQTVDVLNATYDAACLISPPEPVTFTITP